MDSSVKDAEEIELGIYNNANHDIDLNGNSSLDNDDDSLDPETLFSDLPSNLPSRSFHMQQSRKSLRRRLSCKRPSNVGTHNIDPSDILDDNLGIIDLDGVDGDQIRNIPAPMAQKKSVRRASEGIKQLDIKRRSISYWKQLKLRLAMGWTLFKASVGDFVSQLKLWKGALKEIEGHFGNGVLSYFLFLKSLFFINIVIFLIVFGFIVIPQIIINNGDLTLVPGSSIVKPVNSTCPPVNKDFFVNRSIQNNILDFFTGEGYINTTLMFYSNYEGSIYYDKNKNIKYDMALAYLCVGGAYFLASLLLMVKNLAHGFTESIVESGGFFYSYCNKVFAVWDYCIMDEKAAVLKAKSILKDFTAELAEEKRLEKIKNRSNCDKFKIYVLRFFITIVVLGLLAAAIFAIIKSVELSTKPELSREPNTFNVVLKRWASALTISILNLILPIVFELLTQVEDWSPRVEVALTLWRAVLLKLASIAVLVITLFTSYSKHGCKECWENQVGAQMFNLILIDFFVIVGVTILFETGRKYVHRYLRCGCDLGEKIGLQEFQIPKNVLELVYGQSLIWIGSYFAPLIPVVGILKLFILFYVKKISLMYNCKPSSTAYQGARSNYFFMLLLLLTFLLCSVAVGWGLTRIHTSCCGPFKNYGCDTNKQMMDVIGETIEKFPRWIANIIEFLKTTVFIFPLFIIIFLLLYYYHAMTKAHDKMINMLKDQLIMEGRDKRFLMDRLILANELQKKST